MIAKIKCKLWGHDWRFGAEKRYCIRCGRSKRGERA